MLDRLFSVGHSNHTLDHFVQLLRGAAITAVADVRSHPFSQRLPQFNRSELEGSLGHHSISYIFLGDLLGGRPHDTAVYDREGRVDYERVRRTTAFQMGLDRLCQLRERCIIAMLCAEEDPLDCHRGLLIAPALMDRGIMTWHLRGDGQVESQPQFERRLLDAAKVGAGMLDGLFAAMISTEERRELLEEAYRVQAGRKAFRSRTDELLEQEFE